jgi:hypothetical protein
LTALVQDELSLLVRTRDIERANSLLDEERYRAFERTIALFDGVLRSGGEGAEGGAGAFGVTFEHLRAAFGVLLDELDAVCDTASAALDNVFSFVEKAFGEGQEMLMLVTDLSVSRAGMTFINKMGCDAYFKHNQNLQFYERGSDLADRINRIVLEEE